VAASGDDWVSPGSALERIDCDFLDIRKPRGFACGAGRLSLIHTKIGMARAFPIARKRQMTSNEADEASAGTIDTMLALAARSVDNGNDLAIGAGQVVAKRVALGVVAAVNPMAADHAEFARLVPEKVKAFSAAGIAMVEQSARVTNQLARFASDEVLTTARATIEMATCSNPVAVLEAQGRFAHAWWDRAASNFMALGMMALNAQAAALGPLRLAVAANAERLTQPAHPMDPVYPGAATPDPLAQPHTAPAGQTQVTEPPSPNIIATASPVAA
jgi:hypothetical protein